MSTKIIVDKKSALYEIREPEFPPQPKPILLAARVISWIFHPVFLPLYVVFFLVYVHPYLFTGFRPFLKVTTVGMAFLMYTFFPVITVLLLKKLDFISSIYLRTQRDRVIPIIASMTWYFWIAYVWLNYGKTRDAVDMPVEAIRFAMAPFISTVIALMVNIKMKVSLHAIAAGIMLTFILSMAFFQGINFGFYLSAAIFITGLICTARLIASDHTRAEVYVGLLVGIVSMLVANVAAGILM